MNRIMKLALRWAFLISLLAAPCSAATYTYGDLYKEWPGYETSKSSTDAYGNPQIVGAEVITHNGYLKEIDIRFLAEQGIGLWYKGDFNSLFINSNWTGAKSYNSWDYYVRGYFEGTFNSSAVEPAFNEFKTDGYLVSGAPSYTHPSSLSHDGGLLFRDEHPNGLQGSGLHSLASSLVTGYLPDKNSIVLGNTNIIGIQYVFDDNQIAIGDRFVIGYTPYSAGDVFLTPVPEPTTLILLGTGLSLGLCVLRRRKPACP
jgi:hypothetical protein